MSVEAMAGGPWSGRPMLRREDDRLLRGEGCFVDDLGAPGTLHMAVVRSTMAHARLTGLDLGPARAAPGVAAVLAAADLPGVVGAMPVPAPEGAWVADTPVPVLAGDRVRFVGEPVAAVLAESRAQAEDALELVEVGYQPLPPVTLPARALAGGGVDVHDSAPGNILLSWSRSGGDVAGAFQAADEVVSGAFRLPRLVAAPIEPRGCLAAYDPDQDLVTLWCSAQDPHRPLAHLGQVLGRVGRGLRVVVPEVGGAFGSKGALAPEHAAAAAASLLLGRPVKWIEARWENFQAAYQGRGMEAELELALDRSGRFLGLRARLTADLGAYLYPNSPVVPVTAGMLVTGAYDIPAASVEVVGVATNKVPTGPYRGAGRPEAAYFAERMADLAAARLGTDPVEVRLRNLIPRHRFPYRTPLGFTYDSGDYEGALAAAAEALPYRSWRARQEAARDGGEDHLLGIGFALFVERAGAGSWESASLVVEPGGRVVARTGSSPHGQGHETTFAQVVADQLGCRPSEVEVRHGDSSEVPAGVGTFASRSVTVGGSALVVAATEVKAKARGIMAHLFEAAEEDVVWEGGSMAIAGVPDTSRSLGQLAEVAADPSRLPPGMAPGLDARTRFTLEGPVFPFGVYAAVVEIDTGTGRVGIRRLVAVDDAGVVVNPLLAEGQVLGSMAQGVAAALSEEVVHDSEGQLLNGSYLDYGVPGPADLTASVHTGMRCTPSPFNPLGAKGIGESGTIAVPAAVANAVADALGPLGCGPVDPPYTPEKMWRALAGRAGAGIGAGT